MKMHISNWMLYCRFGCKISAGNYADVHFDGVQIKNCCCCKERPKIIYERNLSRCCNHPVKMFNSA